MRRTLKDTFDSISDLLDFIDTGKRLLLGPILRPWEIQNSSWTQETSKASFLRIEDLQDQSWVHQGHSELSVQVFSCFWLPFDRCDQLCHECSQYNYETLSEKKRVYSPVYWRDRASVMV